MNASASPPPPSPDAPLRSRILRSLVVPAAFALVATLLLLFTPSGQQLARWLDRQIRVEETRGRIVDVTTRTGVAGATVVVHSLTDPWKPSIVGESSHGVATTDADGHFVVRYQRLANSRISARAPGYATIFRVPLGEGDVELPTSPAAMGEVEHRGEVGFDLVDSGSVYFDLERHKVVTNADEADFAFRIWSASGKGMMHGLGQAGFGTVEPPVSSNPIDPLAAGCLAPEGDYCPDLVHLGGPPATDITFFARLRDGDRYCRMRLRVYSRGPTADEGYRVEIERWLNTTGGRNVCGGPIEAEASEFAPADRPKR